MESIFSTIIEMSIKASFVIAAILIVRLIIRKAPRKFSYILWAAAGFRLCIPEGYKVDLGFFSPKLQQDIINSVKNTASGTTVTVIGGNTVSPTVQTTVGDTANAVTNGTAGFDWSNFLMNTAITVWFIGVTVMIIYGVISYIKIHRQMRNAILQSGNIYFSDRISAPFTLGFLRPKIYLPYGLSITEQNCIVAHERCHIKRLDHIIKLFAYILLSLHWFNPLCWIAFNRMSLDMEMSCDEIIFRKENYSEMKKDYTRALVSIASKKSFPAPTPITFDDGRSTKKRVTNILNFKKPKIWLNILCYTLCLFILVACGVDAGTIDPQSVGNEVFGDQPYNIIYTSNGDGSCSVSEIRIDRDRDGEIHLIIPEKSPDGDIVTSIDWNGFNGNITLNLPLYLTASQFDAMYGMINDSLDERSAKIVTSFYGQKEKSGMKYYVLEPAIAPEEKERLSKILTNSGYTAQSCLQDTKDFMYRIPETEEELKIFENNAYSYLYRKGEGITEVTVPKTVKYISKDSFYGCQNLKAVYGITEDCIVESDNILALISRELTLSIGILDENKEIGKSHEYEEYTVYNTQFSTQYIFIRTSKPIKNFKFLAMDESQVLTISETLYELEELSPSTRFITNTPINDATISHGISFTDEEGNTRYFVIVFNASGNGDEFTLKEVSF